MRSSIAVPASGARWSGWASRARFCWPRCCTAITIPALALFGWGAGFGAWYFAGVIAAAAILAYEHQLVKPGDLSKLNAAFFNMNAVMSVTVFAFAMLDVLF